MAILVDENTRVLVQGITGREGSFHARACITYGAKVVAGVTPGKGGELFDDKIPVFESVAEAMDQTGANLSLIFVPPPFAPDAIAESAAAGMPLIVCITEGIPVLDIVRLARYLENKPVRLIGPNRHKHERSAVGTGPVDAVYKAVDEIVAVPKRLNEFTIQSITEGIDAIGEVMVRVESDGATYVGRGGSTDIIVASAKAYVNALNHLLANVDIKPAAKAERLGP